MQLPALSRALLSRTVCLEFGLAAWRAKVPGCVGCCPAVYGACRCRKNQVNQVALQQTATARGRTFLRSDGWDALPYRRESRVFVDVENARDAIRHSGARNTFDLGVEVQAGVLVKEKAQADDPRGARRCGRS